MSKFRFLHPFERLWFLQVAVVLDLMESLPALLETSTNIWTVHISRFTRNMRRIRSNTRSNCSPNIVTPKASVTLVDLRENYSRSTAADEERTLTIGQWHMPRCHFP